MEDEQRPAEESTLASDWDFEADLMKEYTPAAPTPAEMFEFLKGSDKLPPPLELAKIAALIGPTGKPDEALRNAAWLFLRAVKFHRCFEEATPEQRACLCGQCEVLLASREANPLVELPPAVEGCDEFLRKVVKCKTAADSEKRLRDFFRAKSPPEQDREDFAVGRLAHFKREGTTAEWSELTDDFAEWWRQEKSRKATESGGRPKSKKSLKKSSARKKRSR